MNFKEIESPVNKNATLNPKLWDAKAQLKPQVRGALLRIAEDFKEYVDVPFKVLDIVVTGSNVAYTYTNKSDLDLHLISDYSSVSCDREVAELFDTKRLLYKRDHSVDIYDIPVELYVEDVKQPAVGSSYSVLHNKWINKPSSHIPDYDLEQVERLTKMWGVVMQSAVKSADLSICRHVMKMLRTYRKLGLKLPEGEFSVPNLVYKSLRNSDSVTALAVMIDRLHDQSLSLGN